MTKRFADVALSASPLPPSAIPALIKDLNSRDIPVRQRAREAITLIGQPAVSGLIQLLESPKPFVRWEAAKALGDIGDPIAAPALVKALEDEGSGIRWLAAEGLCEMEKDALIPLLEALSDWSGAVWLKEGAHHVLHHLAAHGWGELLKPVLAAVDGHDPELDAPVAVMNLLNTLREARVANT